MLKFNQRETNEIHFAIVIYTLSEGGIKNRGVIKEIPKLSMLVF